MNPVVQRPSITRPSITRPSITRPSITRLKPLEFQVYQVLKNLLTAPPLKGHRILLACSGGADSVALAHVLSRLSSRLGFHLSLAYVHHGPTRQAELEEARAQAQALVRALAKELKVSVHITRPARQLLSGEAALREFRLKALYRIRKSKKFTYLAFAHHADDLFETRLVRLVRGTGPQGLQAMKPLEDGVLRPFLAEPRSELLHYLKDKGVTWCEDPSNRESAWLRNWIRNEWLPALEAYRPGATKAFARSLAQMAETFSREHDLGRAQPSKEGDMLSQTKEGLQIQRKSFAACDLNQRQRILARYLRQLNIRDFTSRHIAELCKRLDTPQKGLKFWMLKRHWLVNAERILCVSAQSAT